MHLIRLLHRPDPQGQTLVEYGLLLALIAIVVVAALILLGPAIAQLFTDIGNQLNPVNP